MIGQIFSIEEFSTFDGPGIRTTVFLKGCPLRCSWCHNPEGQTFENQLIKSPNGCLHCNACLDLGEKLYGERKLVKESISICPQNLIRECAIEYTPEELTAQLIKNAALLNANHGGVTFSGGEPLSQPEFLEQCLIQLEGVTNRALQTSGFCPPDQFSRTLKHLDYVLFDLKIIDNSNHIRHTGCSNQLILNNFERLCQSGLPFCIRVPLIPTVTDTTDNIQDIIALMKHYGLKELDLLPYNKMAGSKYQMTGRQYSPAFDQSIPVKPHLDLFTQNGFTANLL